VYADIKLQCLGAKLHMNDYSAGQFGEMKNLCEAILGMYGLTEAVEDIKN